MLDLPPDGALVAPVVVAAVLLVALPMLERLGLAHPTASAVIDATGASRSQAYALRERVHAALSTVQRPVGRPPVPDAEAVETGTIVRAVRDFVFEHPGAVSGNGARRRYSDAFRHAVLDLAAKRRDVPIDVIAEAVGVPEGTLRDWLAGGVEADQKGENLATIPSRDPTGPQIETLLTLWAKWSGSFTKFCEDAQTNWRLPFGRTLIANILEANGVRWPKRRNGRSPDEDALRKQFATYFPNAQWVGDGTTIPVSVVGETHTFNVELMVDACSGALTGVSVRDEEDSIAVIDAFTDGVTTTGSSPLAVLLDNKPCNATDAVKDALGDAKLIAATLARPQNKAHVEGAFGLFAQMVPMLVMGSLVPRDVAKTVLELMVTTWARTLNNRRPRTGDRRSRVERHLDHKPTLEEIERAKQALDERIHKQNEARKTRNARLDPLVRSTLATAFARFGFDDPNGYQLAGTARYPIDVVVDGIAIFEGKRRAGTLPPTADARYLLGIVRNVGDEREGWEIALALWTERSRAHDAALDVAKGQRDAIDERADATAERVVAYVDRALKASRRLDRFFWLDSIADAILDHDPPDHEPLFMLAARRIHATFAVPHPDRLAATRFLAAKLLPIG
jgi:hypothetical protein